MTIEEIIERAIELQDQEKDFVILIQPGDLSTIIELR